MSEKIKIVSYNIHKGKSFFTRQHVLTELKNVIHTFDADLVFLQEIRDFHKSDFKKYKTQQLDFLSDEKYNLTYGKNCIYTNGHHGNGILSKYPIVSSCNYNLTVSQLEKRGVLYNELNIGGQTVHIFCTHLNLRKKERFLQVKLLEEIINDKVKGSEDPVIIAGDFNDFDQSIERHFSLNDYASIKNTKTFPNIYPMFCLDKIFTKNVEIQESYVYRGKELLKLSDHLPLVAQLSLGQGLSQE